MATVFGWGSRDSLPILYTAGSDPLFGRLAVTVVDENGDPIGGGVGTLVDQGSAGVDPWLVETAQLPATLGPKTMAGSLSVTLASDQTPIAVTGTVTASLAEPISVDDNGGSLTVDTPQLPPALGAFGGLMVEGFAFMTPLVVSDGGMSLTVDGTVAITAAALPLPAGASTLAEQQTQTTQLSTLAAATLVDNTAFVDGTSRVSAAGFIFDEVAGTALTENDAAAARIDSKRSVVTVIEDATTRGRRATILVGGALLIDANMTDNNAFTDGTSRVMPSGHLFDEVAGTALTENDIAASRIDSKRAQIFVQEDATTRGQRQAVSAAGRAAVNTITGQDGVQGGSGAVTATTQRVVLADDSPAAITKFTATDDYTGPASGTIVDMSAHPCKHFSLQVSGVGGTITTWLIKLQGSLDGTTFTDILAHGSALGDVAGSTEPSILFSPYNFVRTTSGAVTLGTASAVRAIWLGVP